MKSVFGCITAWMFLCLSLAVAQEKTPSDLPGDDPASQEEPLPEYRIDVKARFEIVNQRGEEKPGVIVETRTNLPEGLILNCVLRRKLLSEVAEPTTLLADTQRFLVGAGGKNEITLVPHALPPARYEVEIFFDPRRQPRAAISRYKGKPRSIHSYAGFQRGDDEEIEFELEWGEGKIRTNVERLYGIFETLREGLPEGEELEDLTRILNRAHERFGKINTGAPLPSTSYNVSERGLKQVSEALLDFLESDPKTGEALSKEQVKEVRDRFRRVYRTFAQEIVNYTAQEMTRWVNFIHQEYWSNRFHQRLTEDEWNAFRTRQKNRLEKLIDWYGGYLAAGRSRQEPSEKEEPETAEKLSPAEEGENSALEEKAGAEETDSDAEEVSVDVDRQVGRFLPPQLLDVLKLGRELMAAYDADVAADRKDPSDTSNELRRRILQPLTPRRRR